MFDYIAILPMTIHRFYVHWSISDVGNWMLRASKNALKKVIEININYNDFTF